MNLPPLPVGIYRDDTVHGKLYYTRQQMCTFAQAVLDAQPKTHTPQSPYSKTPDLPEFMRGMMRDKQ